MNLNLLLNIKSILQFNLNYILCSDLNFALNVSLASKLELEFK